MLIKPIKQSADLISFFSLLLLFYNKEIWFQIMKKVYTSCIHKVFTEVLTLQLPHIYEPTSITNCQQSLLSSTSPTDHPPSMTLCSSTAHAWIILTQDASVENTLQIYVQLWYSTLVIRKPWLHSIIIILLSDLSPLPLPHFRIKFWPPMTLAQNSWKQPPEVQQYLVHQSVFLETVNLAVGKNKRSSNRKLFISATTSSNIVVKPNMFHCIWSKQQRK